MNYKPFLSITLVFLLFTIASLMVNAESDASAIGSASNANEVGYWQPTSMANTLAGRYGHTAVWTGSAVLFWGGYYAFDHFMNDGRLYYPVTDTWASISTFNAPVGRLRHTAVWTGSKMLVWGGEHTGGGATTNTGGIYDLATDTWTAITTTNASSAREMHTAIWTGSEMIVWGGCSTIFCSTIFNDGGRYNPTTDTWTVIPGTELTPRNFHQAIWTGSKMLVWGGTNNPQGMLYDPTFGNWTPIGTTNAPTPTFQGVGVWTGREMLVWGGCTNFTTTACGSYVNTGGRYNPSTDTWSPITQMGAPTARWTHSGVWTGKKLIIWGGCGDRCYNTGGIYDPEEDTWLASSTVNVPTSRSNHKAVWTGTNMVVWGGCDFGGCGNVNYFTSGGRFTLYAYFFPFIFR